VFLSVSGSQIQHEMMFLKNKRYFTEIQGDSNIVMIF